MAKLVTLSATYGILTRSAVGGVRLEIRTCIVTRSKTTISTLASPRRIGSPSRTLPQLAFQLAKLKKEFATHSIATAATIAVARLKVRTCPVARRKTTISTLASA